MDFMFDWLLRIRCLPLWEFFILYALNPAQLLASSSSFFVCLFIVHGIDNQWSAYEHILRFKSIIWHAEWNIWLNVHVSITITLSYVTLNLFQQILRFFWVSSSFFTMWRRGWRFQLLGLSAVKISRVSPFYVLKHQPLPFAIKIRAGGCLQTPHRP